MNGKLKEECGVFGAFGAPEGTASQLVYYGLFAQQHRGQESAGMAVIHNGNDMLWYKGQGLVSDVFDKRMLTYLEGSTGIGHVRYSTTGASNLETNTLSPLNTGENTARGLPYTAGQCTNV